MSLAPNYTRVARELIAPLIPADTRSRVDRARKQWSASIREYLRSETRLRLADADERHNVPVRLQEGFRDSLAQIIAELNDPILWVLILGQPYLAGLARGTTFLLQHWPDISQWPRLPEQLRNSGAAVEATRDLGETLAGLIDNTNLRARVAAIHDDILGMYTSGPTAAIDLYWMPIGMFAGILGCTIEELTVVVLVHELAHAFTHLGLDIDGQHWTTATFQRTDKPIKEGLAQFYTAKVVERLGGRAPGISEAYERLLTWQSGPYLVHLEWGQNSGQIGEQVRAAMLSCRNQELTAYSQFREHMQEAATRLRRRPRPEQGALL